MMLDENEQDYPNQEFHNCLDIWKIQYLDSVIAR